MRMRFLIGTLAAVVLYTALALMAGCNALPQSGVGDTAITAKVEIHVTGAAQDPAAGIPTPAVTVSGVTVDVDNSGDATARQTAQPTADGKLDVTVPIVGPSSHNSQKGGFIERLIVSPNPPKTLKSMRRRKRRCKTSGSTSCIAARLGRLGGLATARKRRKGKKK